MPGFTRHGDTAGGASISSQSTVKANSKKIIVHGDSVTPHGDSPHDAATMIAGSDNVFIGGTAVVNAGDRATCSHTSDGSSDVNVGD